jgi:hypothetical protein
VHLIVALCPTLRRRLTPTNAEGCDDGGDRAANEDGHRLATHSDSSIKMTIATAIDTKEPSPNFTGPHIDSWVTKEQMNIPNKMKIRLIAPLANMAARYLSARVIVTPQ